jgi:hypothetical protein
VAAYFGAVGGAAVVLGVPIALVNLRVTRRMPGVR